MTLAKAIASVESDGRWDAIRFEPHVYERALRAPIGRKAISRLMHGHGLLSRDTYRVLWSSSWGRFQIMGFNLWGDICSYDGHFADFLKNHDAQEAALLNFLRANKINYSLAELIADREKLNDFARKYNGPGNVKEYGTKIRQAALRLLAAK